MQVRIPEDTSPAYPVSIPDEAVRAKSLPGGTAPDAVRAALDAALSALEREAGQPEA